MRTPPRTVSLRTDPAPLPTHQEFGGVVSRRVLLAAGHSPADVRRGLRHGDLVRLRRGWYALPEADPLVVRAVRGGGVVACVSALELRGVWRPLTQEDLHTRRSPDLAPQARRQTCQPRGVAPATLVAVDELPLALRCATVCLPAEDVVAVMDSLLHRRLMGHDELEHTLRHEPLWVRALLARCAPAESGSESLVRFRLTSLGYRVRSQVWIGPDRVDLLVGERLVIEVDSVQHHTGQAAYQSDRSRDRRLMAQGCVVVRLTWSDVHLRWDQTLQDLRALLVRGDHRARR